MHACAARRQAEALEANDLAEASSRRVEVLQRERSRRFLRGAQSIGDALRATFRSLCKHGDAALEYADVPSILFAEGVSIAVKPPHGEWTRFEMLSGGQQALVAVALTMALQEGTYLERHVEREAGERTALSEGYAIEGGSEGGGEVSDASPPPFVLFDEIDAALDTQKVRALAEHVRARAAGQTVFVSHRKELIEASGRLVGTFMVDGGTRAVSVPFGA